jgi:hypothetical protein
MSIAIALAPLLFLQQTQSVPPPPPPKPATESAVLDQPYIMGEKGSALNFTLTAAKVAEAFPGAEENYAAKKNERLLALYFTVQNPNKQDISIGSSTFQFNVTSPEDENFTFRGYLLNATKRTHMSQSLKYNQSVKCVVVFPIHAYGEVNNVQIQRGEDYLLRYDVNAKLTLYQASAYFQGTNLFTNPNVVSRKGSAIAVGGYGVFFDGIEFTNEKIMGYAPPEDHTYMVVNVKFNSQLTLPLPIGFQIFTLDVRRSRGTAVSWNRALLQWDADEYLSQNVDRTSVKARYYVAVPNDDTDLKVKLIHNESGREIYLEVPER